MISKVLWINQNEKRKKKLIFELCFLRYKGTLLYLTPVNSEPLQCWAPVALKIPDGGKAVFLKVTEILLDIRTDKIFLFLDFFTRPKILID